MKKIIMVMAIVCAVACTHAATVGWSLAGLGNYKNDAYAFFVIGQNGVTSVAQIADLVAAGADISSYAFGSGTVSGTGTAMTAAASSGKKLDGGVKYDSFFVLFNNEATDKADKYLAVTSAQAAGLTQTPKDTAATFSFAGANQQTFVNNATWAAISGTTPSGVPEPTSTMLLVLGMAGLALRRKHA